MTTYRASFTAYVSCPVHDTDTLHIQGHFTNEKTEGFYADVVTCPESHIIEWEQLSSRDQINIQERAEDYRSDALADYADYITELGRER